MCTLQNTRGAATEELHTQRDLGQNLKGQTSSCRNQRELMLLPPVLLCTWAAWHAKHSEQTAPRSVGQQVPQFSSVLCWSVLPFAYFNFCYLVIALGSLLQEQRRALGEAVIFYSCFPMIFCCYCCQSCISSHYFFFKLKNSGLFNLYWLFHIADEPGYKAGKKKKKGSSICLLLFPKIHAEFWTRQHQGCILWYKDGSRFLLQFVS